MWEKDTFLTYFASYIGLPCQLEIWEIVWNLIYDIPNLN